MRERIRQRRRSRTDLRRRLFEYAARCCRDVRVALAIKNETRHVPEHVPDPAIANRAPSIIRELSFVNGCPMDKESSVFHRTAHVGICRDINDTPLRENTLNRTEFCGYVTSERRIGFLVNERWRMLACKR